MDVTLTVGLVCLTNMYAASFTFAASPDLPPTDKFINKYHVGSRSQLNDSYTNYRQRKIDELLANYDPHIPPNYEEDFPVEVYVQLHITSIDSIRETDMDFSMSMILRQTWNDTRLIYKKLDRLRSLELDSSVMEKIWVPDLFFSNEKQATVHEVTVPNKLMHIYPQGRIQYSVRISATFTCNMDLKKYPLDSQICYVVMESYGYSTDNLVFIWHPQPVLRADNLILPQFDLGNIETERCDKQYIGINYTCVKLKFQLTRDAGYYVTQIYIPSILIVILSWVSFWLDMDAVPARISLGLLTVLTMTTQSSGARASLPRVSYVKSIDVWMATCLIFVFSALIEFAYVNVLSRVEKRRQSTINIKTETRTSFIEKNGDAAVKLLPSLRCFPTSREKARVIDKLSRVIFPTIFILFNVIYWSVYIFWEPDRSHLD